MNYFTKFVKVRACFIPITTKNYCFQTLIHKLSTILDQSILKMEKLKIFKNLTFFCVNLTNKNIFSGNAILRFESFSFRNYYKFYDYKFVTFSNNVLLDQFHFDLFLRVKTYKNRIFVRPRFSRKTRIGKDPKMLI